MKPLTGAALLLVLAIIPAAAQTDLDAFMQRVIERRDDNWKKLQQYILDEREVIELRGPDRTVMWGDRREFTWYMRDDRFVRSPVRFNGVAIGDADRRKYEADFIKREQEREKRRAEDPTEIAADPAEPQFVTSAYFLRFKFEPGRYALVGREAFGGETVLRIEYYPSRLYADDHPAENERSGRRQQDDEEARLERQMNKVALVTLWVAPDAHQIVKYTFDNVGFEFLPGRSFVRVQDVRASMEMGQPFPGVWLPRAIDGRGEFTLANGTYTVKYDLEYSNYRLADVKVRLR